MNTDFRVRRQTRVERVKWLPRFTALRDITSLKSSALQLHQDLVDAAHEADINPDRTSQEGMAKPVR